MRPFEELESRPLSRILPVLVILLVALAYAGPGLLPGRVLLPLDLLAPDPGGRH
jgi:hypothetical protein